MSRETLIKPVHRASFLLDVAELTEAPYYSIGAVARRIGLSEHMLRAWERRYRVVAPKRSQGKHRRYSEHDVRRLQLLSAAQRSGGSIGELARLTDAQIISLLQRADAAPQLTPLAAQVDACEQAIVRLDPWLLAALVDRAVASLGHVAVAESLIAPVMQRVGRRWADGELAPHHEHLASATFRTFLGAALTLQRPSGEAPTVVAGTLSGEQHELGILAAAVVAVAEGWQVVYLGTDTPAQGMVATVAAHRPEAILIGFAGSPIGTSRLHDLQVVVHGAASSTMVLCGGAGANAGRREIEARGAVVADLGGLRATLRMRFTDGSPGGEPPPQLRTRT